MVPLFSTGLASKGASRFFLLLLPGLILFSGCNEKKEVQVQKAQQLQQQFPEQADAEQVEILSETQYSHLLGDLLSIQEKIKQAPDDAAYRLDLLQGAVRRAEKKIYMAGAGRLPEESSSAAVLQNAERAAMLDAARWVGYALEWKKHPDQPAFGALQARIPPVKIVYKSASPEQVVVLVAADLP
jgi:hypothetical protein